METNLRDILFTIWKRKKLFTLIFILSTPTFLVLKKEEIRQYKAVSKVKLAKVSYIPIIMKSVGIDYKEIALDLDYEAGNIKSEEVLKRALEILGVQPTPERILDLERRIGVDKKDPKEMTIDIYAIHQSPEEATKIANAVAIAFAEYSKIQLTKDVEETIKILENVADNIEKVLEKNYQDFADFTREKGVFDPSTQFKMEIENLYSLTRNLIEVEQKLNIIKSLSQEIEPQNIVEITPLIPQISQLYDEWIKLNLQREKLLQNYTTAHPAVKEITQNILLLQDKIKNLIEFEIKNLEKQKEELSGRISEIYSHLVEYPDIAVGYLKHKNRIEILNNIFTEYYLGLLNIKMAGNIRVSIASLFKKAYFAQDVSRRGIALSTLLGLGMVLGLVLGFLSVFIAESLETKFSDIEEIERATSIPVVGIIPYSKEKEKLPVVSKPNARISEGIKSLKVSLEIKLPTKFTLGVVSSLPNEGKTFVASNLAMSFQQGGKETILIDLNIRNPQIHKIFGFDLTPGFVDMVIADLQVEEVVKIPYEGADLKVITTGPKHPSPPDFLISEEVKYVIQNLKRVADVIILDSSPLLAAPDILSLSDVIDAFLIVMDIRRTKRPQIMRTKSLLERAGAKIIGIVVNYASEDVVPTIGYYYHNYDKKEKKRKKHKRRSDLPKISDIRKIFGL